MREVVVTGVGLVSSLGEGAEPHLAALRGSPSPRIDHETFAPYPVHPMAALDLDRQIPKKSDQRQMEPWQRLGCYAAGLALDAAGVKDDAALKAGMHLIVAAGGGERDYTADGAILTGLATAPDKGRFLNERLMGDLRPTLFLAQLSNLLAGNIAIVHGVTGASRTFMGEESSGVDALRIAQARIASGQNDIFLVGGSYNAERPDVILLDEMGGCLWKRPFLEVWSRPDQGGGFILGSGAAFLVLEARDHAAARGVTALASLAPVLSDRIRRVPGAVEASLEALWTKASPGPDAVVISGASGLAEATAAERRVLDRRAPRAVIHATGDLVGHTMEPQSLFGAAFGALLIAAAEAGEAVVTSIGHQRGEGLVRLTRPR